MPVSMSSFCKATEGFYSPQQFLILCFLVCLKGKIRIDCRRIRTYDFALHVICLVVRTADYQLGYAPLLQSLLEMKISKSIYKHNVKK
jgi:hypothetical protein